MSGPCHSHRLPEKRIRQNAHHLKRSGHSIFYAPQYAAIELGYFDEEGLDVTLVNGGGADKVMTALVSGEADHGFMGSEASVYTMPTEKPTTP